MSQSQNWVSEEIVAKLRAKPFPEGSIVFPKIGAALRTNKKRILSRDSLVDNNVMALVVRDEDQCLSRFLYYFFLTIDLTDLANPGTVPSLTSTRVKELTIPLPPLDQQKKIVAVLSSVQRAIEQQEGLIALTTELKQSLMHKLVTEGLHGEPQKQTEIGPVPEGWELLRFDDCVEVARGQVDPRLEPYKSMLHVGPENIEPNTGRLGDLDTNEALGIASGNYYFDEKHVLYSKIRPYLNKVALPNFEGTCSADMYPLLPRPESLTRGYLFQFLLSDPFKKQAVSFQDRTGIPKINRAQLGSVLVPIPTLDEQERIAYALGTCDEEVEMRQRNKELLNELFRTLLHKLMTAQIRVDDLDVSMLEGS